MQDKNDFDVMCINTTRTLSMDAVQAANSAHPCEPMAMASVAYCLWQQFLRLDPQDLMWPNRDRFVLSAGTASLAGHLTLSNLCWIYNNNHILIERNTALAFSEDANGVRVGDRVEMSDEMLSATLGPGLLGRVYDGLQNPLHELLEQGNSIDQMMQVTGEEGITLEDDCTWQKSVFVETAYLQQDAFSEQRANNMHEQLVSSFEGQDLLTRIEENIHTGILASAPTRRGHRLVLKSSRPARVCRRESSGRGGRGRMRQPATRRPRYWPAYFERTSSTTRAAPTPTCAKSLARSPVN
jgi:hypothetical protein